MSLRHKIRTRRALLLITYLSLACKLLIPVGYMPAALGDGWPVTMCYSGLPAGMLSHDGTQHHHDEKDDLLWEKCSLGALISSAVVTSEQTLHLPYPGKGTASVAYAWNSIDALDFVYQARAPPTSIV